MSMPRRPTAVTLADIRAARAVDRRRRQAHADRHVGRRCPSGTGGDGRAQGREPAAHGGVQDPRGDEQAGLARPGGGQRRHGRQRRQPRPGARLRRPPLRRAVRHLRARPARRSPRSRRAGPTAPRSSRAAPRSTRPWPPPGTRAAERGHGVLPPVRRPGGRRRAGHARPRARRGPRPTWRASSSRSAAAGWPPGVAIAVKSLLPDVRIIGVQAAVCAPYAGGAVADRAGGRRSPTASPSSTRASSPARWSSGGSTRSSPSTRTPSPTPWCC